VNRQNVFVGIQFMVQISLRLCVSEKLCFANDCRCRNFAFSLFRYLDPFTTFIFYFFWHFWWKRQVASCLLAPMQ